MTFNYSKNYKKNKIIIIFFNITQNLKGNK